MLSCYLLFSFVNVMLHIDRKYKITKEIKTPVVEYDAPKPFLTK